MLEAQETTPTGGEEGGRVMTPPGPAAPGVIPVAYADGQVPVRKRASSAIRADLAAALPLPAVQRQRERRQSI